MLLFLDRNNQNKNCFPLYFQILPEALSRGGRQPATSASRLPKVEAGGTVQARQTAAEAEARSGRRWLSFCERSRTS